MQILWRDLAEGLIRRNTSRVDELVHGALEVRSIRHNTVQRVEMLLTIIIMYLLRPSLSPRSISSCRWKPCCPPPAEPRGLGISLMTAAAL